MADNNGAKIRHVYVLTADGQLSAIDVLNKAKICWSRKISVGPLISSNLHKCVFSDKVQSVRLVPSLNGNIYIVFANGIKPIPISRDSVCPLSEPFEDLTMSIESRTQTIYLSRENGQILHINTTNRKTSNSSVDNFKNSLLVTRKTTVMRATEKGSLNERFSFRVGLNDLSLFEPNESADDCKEADDQILGPNRQSGFIYGQTTIGRQLVEWSLKFSSSIIAAWRINQYAKLESIDLFKAKYITAMQSSLYLSVYRNNFYIQELKTANNFIENGLYKPNIMKCNLMNFVSTERKAISQLKTVDGIYFFTPDDFKFFNTNMLNERIDFDIEPSVQQADEFIPQFKKEFEFIKCLGSGAYGIVLQAKNYVDQQHYAIKRIKLSKSKEKRHLEAIRREVGALANLEHPNIVRYFRAWVEKPPIGWQEEQDEELKINQSSFSTSSTSIVTSQADEATELKQKLTLESVDDDGEDEEQNAVADSEITEEEADETDDSPETQFIDNLADAVAEFKKMHFEMRPTSVSPIPNTYFYIQMQLCSELNLKKWIFENNPLARQPHVADIFQQIIDGVKYIHEKKLIHRDLKPDNIFFVENHQIKIGDFGLVRNDLLTSDFGYGSSQSLNVGTEFYKAPEMQSGQSYDCKVDIYALGIIYFELLVYFGTEMERRITLKKLSGGEYPKDFEKSFAAEFCLLRQMLAFGSYMRPTAVELKEQFQSIAKTTLRLSGNRSCTEMRVLYGEIF